METRQITTTVIEAAEGKLLRRRSDKTVYGKTVYLGYNYYENGGRIEPRQDTPEDFEEFDAPEDNKKDKNEKEYNRKDRA